MSPFLPEFNARLVNRLSRKSENTVPSLSYLSFLRNPDVANQLAVESESDWFNPKNQQWVLERRLATLVKAHLEATSMGKDTSFTVHELTMAHCDFTYWRGFWNAINKAARTEFYPQLEALVQVVKTARTDH